MRKTISVEIKEFISLRFSNDAEFDNLCRELGISNHFGSGDFRNKVTVLVSYLEANYPGPVEMVYNAILKLKPNFKIDIDILFEVNAKDLKEYSVSEITNSIQPLKRLFILHISDIHYNPAKDWNMSELYNDFLEDIERWKLESKADIDMLFFTGDIVSSGEKMQYEAIQEKIERIIQVSGCSNRQTFFVPGNHDMSAYDRLSDEEKRILEEVVSGNRKVNESVLSDYSNFSFLVEKFSNYNDFLNNLGCSHCINSDIEKPWYVGSLDDTFVQVIGLNSALFSCRGFGEDGKLRMGSRQLYEALDYNREISIKIILTHHPLDWLVREEREDLEKKMAKHRVIHLHGHVHKSKQRKLSYLNNGKEYLPITGGSLFGEGGDKYYNSYHILELRIFKDCVEVKPTWGRRWEPDEDEWCHDSRWDGQEFKIQLRNSN